MYMASRRLEFDLDFPVNHFVGYCTDHVVFGKHEFNKYQNKCFNIKFNSYNQFSSKDKNIIVSVTSLVHVHCPLNNPISLQCTYRQIIVVPRV